MVTYERSDVLMHGANGRVIVHPVTNTSQVAIKRTVGPGIHEQATFFGKEELIGREDQLAIRWSSTTPKDHTITSYESSDRGRIVSLDPISNRFDIGYRRTITFADPSDIGFDAINLICIGECWMHVSFYTDVIEQIRVWEKRHIGYPKQRVIRQFHAEAVRRVIERIMNEGKEKYSREDRSYRDNSDWDGIPVVESSTVRLWRVREDEMIRVRQVLSRTWRDGYAPKVGS